MSIQKGGLFIVSIVGCICCIVPWVTVPLLGTLAGYETGIGLFSLACFAVIMIISLTGSANRDLTSGYRFTVALASIFSGGAALVYSINLNNTSSFGFFNQSDFHIEFGTIGCMLSAGFTLMFLLMTRSEIEEKTKN